MGFGGGLRPPRWPCACNRTTEGAEAEAELLAGEVESRRELRWGWKDGWWKEGTWPPWDEGEEGGRRRRWCWSAGNSVGKKVLKPLCECVRGGILIGC